MNMYLSWALLCLLAEALTVLVKILLRKKKFRPVPGVLLTVSELLIAVACAALVMAGPLFLRPVQPFLFALYAVLFADFVAGALYSLVCKVIKKEKNFVFGRCIGALFALAFVLYGTLNMQSVKPDYHTYYSPKISGEQRIVFAADMHTGSAQSFETTKSTVEAMKSVHADCIILGGDIVDDYTTLEEMRDTFALFADSKAPVYYIYGNHDRQKHADYAKGRQFTEQQLADALAENGITALTDEYARVNPELLILGREDASEKERRKDISALENPDPGAYLVVADHQPVKAEDNLASGMDLQLSGHTHAGQLFPLGLLYRTFGKVSGDYTIGSAVMNVSPGTCGWRVPFRTDSHCRFEVISIMPMK